MSILLDPQMVNPNYVPPSAIPTELELYDLIDALTKENEQLKQELVEEKRLVANIARDFAFHRAYELIPYNKSDINFMSLNRVDKNGYHFTYTVLEDNSKHKICVMQTDLR